MTHAVSQIVNAFEALPEVEKYQAAVEILRRAPSGDQSDSFLLEAADELFRALDAEEEYHARR